MYFQSTLTSHLFKKYIIHFSWVKNINNANLKYCFHASFGFNISKKKL